MYDSTKYTSKTLREMFQNMFLISTFCGVFPFVFRGNDLVLSCIFFPISIIYVTIVGFSSLYFLAINFNYKSIQLNTYSLTLNYSSPVLVAIFVPIVSVSWLLINLKMFRKIFLALKVVESVIKTSDPLPLYKSHFLFFLIIPVIVIDYYWSDYIITYSIFLYLMICNVHLVTVQFTSILITIRNYYSSLENTLCNSTAMEWAQCHEVLGACCEIVNRCYAPPLLIITLSTFSFITTTIYIMIAHDSFYIDNNRILAIIWVSVSTLRVLYFISHCHETVQTAKRFDKALYRLVLNDDTKKLLRNKRIRHHFTAKRKVEFSAMGFFNFDYSLIGNMVSTATTYIVIMVQFTP